MAAMTDHAGHAGLLDTPAAPLRIGVVLFGNPRRQIARLLDCLERAAAEPGAPAVAARFLDHSADDAAAAGFEERGLGHLYRRASNAGFGAGHNKLLAEAFAEPEALAYLCLNPDAIPHPSLFVELWRALEGSPEICLVEALQFPDEHPKPYDPTSGRTQWCSGCALLVPRRLHAAIGGFDERYFVFCEDVDLSWRARAADFPLRVAPRALVHHYVGDRRFDRGREILLHRSAALLGARFGNAGFARGQQAGLRRLGATPAPLRIERPAPALAAVADLDHGYSFTTPRWGPPAFAGELPQPLQPSSPPPPRPAPGEQLDDGLVTVVLRCEGPLAELDGALFALACAAPGPMQIVATLSAGGPSRAEVEALLRRHQPLGGYDFSLGESGAIRGRLIAFHAAGERIFPGHFEGLTAALRGGKAAWALARSRRAELVPGSEAPYVAGKHDLGPIELARAALLLGELPPACAALFDRERLPANFIAQQAEDDRLRLLRLAASVPCALVSGPPSCERRAPRDERPSAAELELRAGLVAQLPLAELREFAEALARRPVEAPPLPLRYRLADRVNGALKAGLGPLHAWMRSFLDK